MMELPHSSSTIHHIETPWFLSNRRSQPDISHPFLPRPTQHRRAVLLRLFLLLPTQAAPARSVWMKMTIAMHASLGRVAPPAFVRPVVYGCAQGAIQLALFAANVWSHRILWLAPTVWRLSETQTRSGFRATMLGTEHAHFLRAVFARTTLRRWTSSFASVDPNLKSSQASSASFARQKSWSQRHRLPFGVRGCQFTLGVLIAAVAVKAALSALQRQLLTNLPTPIGDTGGNGDSHVFLTHSTTAFFLNAWYVVTNVTSTNA